MASRITLSTQWSRSSGKSRGNTSANCLVNGFSSEFSRIYMIEYAYQFIKCAFRIGWFQVSLFEPYYQTSHVQFVARTRASLLFDFCFITCLSLMTLDLGVKHSLRFVMKSLYVFLPGLARSNGANKSAVPEPGLMLFAGQWGELNLHQNMSKNLNPEMRLVTITTNPLMPFSLSLGT